MGLTTFAPQMAHRAHVEVALTYKAILQGLHLDGRLFAKEMANRGGHAQLQTVK